MLNTKNQCKAQRSNTNINRVSQNNVYYTYLPDFIFYSESYNSIKYTGYRNIKISSFK